jgi:hypothetical protein
MISVVDVDRCYETMLYGDIVSLIKRGISSSNKSRYGYFPYKDPVTYLDLFNSILKDGDLFPVQISAGSMSNLNVIWWSDKLVSLTQSKKIRLFVQLPFCINWDLSSSFASTEVDSYLSQLYELYSSCHVPVDFILHCSLDISNINYDRIRHNLARWNPVYRTGGMFLLENRGCFSTGELQSTLRICLDVALDLNRGSQGSYGICLDTEHAWAEGVLFSDLVAHKEVLSDLVKLVHCNGAPSSIGFGSGYEYHSYTSLINSIGRVFSVDQMDNNYLYCLSWLVSVFNSCPFIFERALMSLQAQDVLQMESWFD